MKLSTREDIEAPIESVFSVLCDFDRYERQILRRGADVSRIVDKSPPGPGMTWEVVGTFRGKRRTATTEITDFDRPNGLACETRVGGLEGSVQVELLALSPKRTRMIIGVELRPTTLSSRLLVQSLRFAKGSLNKRFKSRIGAFAEKITERYRNGKIA